MSQFRMGVHMATGQKIVEVLDDQGGLLGVIYPVDGPTVHIVSKHFADDVFEPSHGILATPGYLLKFKSP